MPLNIVGESIMRSYYLSTILALQYQSTITYVKWQPTNKHQPKSIIDPTPVILMAIFTQACSLGTRNTALQSLLMLTQCLSIDLQGTGGRVWTSRRAPWGGCVCSGPLCSALPISPDRTHWSQGNEEGQRVVSHLTGVLSSRAFLTEVNHGATRDRPLSALKAIWLCYSVTIKYTFWL